MLELVVFELKRLLLTLERMDMTVKDMTNTGTISMESVEMGAFAHTAMLSSILVITAQATMSEDMMQTGMTRMDTMSTATIGFVSQMDDRMYTQLMVDTMLKDMIEQELMPMGAMLMD